MDDYLAKPIRPNELGGAEPRASAHDPHGERGGAGDSLDASAIESLRELGGEEFLAEVIDTFLSDAPALVATLRDDAEEGDTEGLRRAAHTLKSNGQTFGAGTLLRALPRARATSEGGELDGTAELVDRIEREYPALEKARCAPVDTPS